MKLDHETFRLVGESLHGVLWQAPLAQQLGVAIRTLQRWREGEMRIPPGVWLDLSELCAARGIELDKLAADLRAAAKEGK